MPIKREHSKQFNFRGPEELLDRFKKICESRGEYTGPTMVALIRLYVDHNGELGEAPATQNRVTAISGTLIAPDTIEESTVEAFRTIFRSTGREVRNMVHVVLSMAQSAIQNGPSHH